MRTHQPSPGKDCTSKQHTATSKLRLSFLLQTLPFQIKWSSCWVSRLLHHGATGPGDPAWELTAELCQDFYFTGCNAFRKLPLEYIFNGMYFSWKRLTHSRLAANISSCLDEALSSQNTGIKAWMEMLTGFLGCRDGGGEALLYSWRANVKCFWNVEERLFRLSDVHTLFMARVQQGVRGMEGEETPSPSCDPPATRVLVSYTIRVAFHQEMCNCI